MSKERVESQITQIQLAILDLEFEVRVNRELYLEHNGPSALLIKTAEANEQITSLMQELEGQYEKLQLIKEELGMDANAEKWRVNLQRSNGKPSL